ncbi:hypothetical protein EON63_16245 [archaeon]|nr:MAG: hypothetical protein EON63_16245 [archaeon]
MSSSASNKKRHSNGGGPDGGGNNDAIKVVCRFRPERSGPGNSKPGTNSGLKPESFALNPLTGEVKYASEFSDSRSFIFDKVTPAFKPMYSPIPYTTNHIHTHTHTHTDSAHIPITIKLYPNTLSILHTQ